MTWPATLRRLEDDLNHINDVADAEAVSWLKTVRIWVHEDGDWPAGVPPPRDGFLPWIPDPLGRIFQTGRHGTTRLTSIQPAMQLHEWHSMASSCWTRPPWHPPHTTPPWLQDATTVFPMQADGTSKPTPTSAAEYFAELTEAWFGDNDYYPFDRADLLSDPVGAAVVEEVWTLD